MCDRRLRWSLPTLRRTPTTSSAALHVSGRSVTSPDEQVHEELQKVDVAEDPSVDTSESDLVAGAPDK